MIKLGKVVLKGVNWVGQMVLKGMYPMIKSGKMVLKGVKILWSGQWS